MPVHVSHRALKNSFVRLCRDSAALTGRGSHLLLAYAVECGLKAVLLKRRKRESTQSLAASLSAGSTGHDLRVLAKELNLAASVYAELLGCHRGDGAHEMIAVAEVHQAWRYGAELDPGDEGRFVAGLRRLSAWCGEELRA